MENFSDLRKGMRVLSSANSPFWAYDIYGNDLNFYISPAEEGTVREIHHATLCGIVEFDLWPGHKVSIPFEYLSPILTLPPRPRSECICPLKGPYGLMALGCQCGAIDPHKPRQIIR